MRRPPPARPTRPSAARPNLPAPARWIPPVAARTSLLAAALLAAAAPVLSPAPLAADGRATSAPAAVQEPPSDTVPPSPPPEGRTWKAWARDGLAFAALLALDRPVRTAARELAADAPEDGLLDEAADRAEWFGDWEGSLPWVVGGSLAVGGVTGGADGAKEAAALLAGAAAGSFANEAVNRAVGRGRPSWEEGAFSLRPFRGHASFPSGHTAYVFGVASGIDVVTDGWLPAAAAYGVAGMTGLSRVYHDRHWLTDVAAGAALSTVVSRVATRRALDVLGVDGSGGDGDASGRRGSTPRRGGGGRERARGLAPPPRLELLATPRALGITLRF